MFIQRTTTKQKTRDPEWLETFETDLLRHGPLAPQNLGSSHLLKFTHNFVRSGSGFFFIEPKSNTKFSPNIVRSLLDRGHYLSSKKLVIAYCLHLTV